MADIPAIRLVGLNNSRCLSVCMVFLRSSVLRQTSLPSTKLQPNFTYLAITKPRTEKVITNT